MAVSGAYLLPPLLRYRCSSSPHFMHASYSVVMVMANATMITDALSLRIEVCNALCYERQGSSQSEEKVLVLAVISGYIWPCWL